MLLNTNQHLSELKHNLQDINMICTVSFTCHLYTVLHLWDKFAHLFFLEEMKTVGKMNDPCVGMVTWKARKNFDGFIMVGKSIFCIVKNSKIFVKIWVVYGILNIIFTNLFCSDINSLRKILLKSNGFTHTNQYSCFLLIYRS